MDQTDSHAVSPEEQQLYDHVMLAARQNIFGDKNDDTRFKMVVQRLLKGRDELASNIGGIAAVTMINIAGAIQKQGKQVPGDILLHAGDELVDNLIQIAEEAKLAKPSEHDELKKQAMFDGIKLYAQSQKGQGQGAAPAQPGPPQGQPPQPAQPPTPPPQAPGIINAARGA